MEPPTPPEQRPISVVGGITPPKWPLVLSWTCFVVSIFVSLYTASTGRIEDPRSIDENFYNLIATAGWALTLLAQLVVGAVLLIATHKFGKHALVNGSKRSAWGLAIGWLIVLRIFGVMEPGAWYLLAPAALGWLYVALMMRTTAA
jgi:hypothetical protein